MQQWAVRKLSTAMEKEFFTATGRISSRTSFRVLKYGARRTHHDLGWYGCSHEGTLISCSTLTTRCAVALCKGLERLTVLLE